MNQLIKLLGAAIIGWLCLSNTLAQNKNDYLGRSPIPPSPEAAALGKYGDIPVSYYTGIPEINIPLTEISDGKLTLPISLSYHSGGHRVEEVGSWVGLGWTLNSGGVVTRVVRGFPDEINEKWNDYFNKPPSALFDGTQLTANEKFAYLSAANEGCIDLERDFYFFNFNGNSGKFFFDWNNNLVVSSNRPIKIEPVYVLISRDNPSLEIQKWIITDDRGVRYEFDEVERTYQINVSSWVPKCHRNSDKFNSSWYLSRLTDANQEDEITLEYEGFAFEYPMVPVERREYLIGSSAPLTTEGGFVGSATQLSYSSKRIRKIKSSHNPVVIEFITAPERRRDIANENLTTNIPRDSNYDGTNGNVKALNRVIIYYNGIEERSFELVQNYSIGRLALEKINEFSDGRLVSPPHIFEYSGFIPDYKSKAQDHWGFYNQIGNSTLIPFRDLNPLDIRGPIIEMLGDAGVYGAVRTPDFEGSKSGVLKSITYPTRGKTEFTYELNDYSFVQGTDVSSYNEYVKENRALSASHSGQRINETGLKSTSVDLMLTEETPAKIKMYGFAGTSAATQNTRPTATLYDATGNKVSGITLISDGAGNFQEKTDYKILPAGQYRLEAKVPLANPDENPYAIIEVNYLKTTSSRIVKKPTGGVRIAQITDVPTTGTPLIRKFSYKINDDPEKSSGVIYHEAKYAYEFTKIFGGTFDPGTGSITPEGESQIIVRLAQNRSIFGDTQGSHIGYAEVHVEQGAGSFTNGKTIYKFNSPINYSDGISEEFPFQSPDNSQAHKTGLLKEQVDYKKTDTGFIPVRKITNTYDFKDFGILSTKIAFKGGGVTGPQYLYKYILGRYLLNMGFAQLIESKEELLYQDKAATNRSESQFDTNLQKVKRQIRHLSDRSQIATEFYYAEDYQSPGEAISLMRDFNMMGIPVEIITKRKVENSEEIVSGQYTKFQKILEGNKNKIRVREEYKLDVEGSLPSGNFSPSADNANGIPDQNYSSQAVAEKYDARSRALQYTFRNGITKSYIWDYFGEFPIAEVTNAKSADIAFTSFESSQKGQWEFTLTRQTVDSTQSRTGEKSYKLGAGSITKNGLDSTKAYVISFWVKGAPVKLDGEVTAKQGETVNGWTYYEKQIVNQSKITISGDAHIDELRLFPYGSEMTTYCYDPMVGLLSSSDANGRTNFYQYQLNRLKSVRDSDQNIIKLFDYQYKKN